MKRSLLVSFLGLNVSLFGAVDRRLNLDPAPTAMHEHIALMSYQAAKKAVGKELTGTVAEFYSAITAQGYQQFLDENPYIEQRTLEIMDLFTDPVVEVFPLAGAFSLRKIAVNTFQAALADPHNIDLWLQEFYDFSQALIFWANKMITLPSFKARADVTSRLIDNNGIFVTDVEQRAAMLACMVAVTARFTQRYRAMGAETFEAFKKRAPEVIQKLAQEEQSAVVLPEVYAHTGNEN